MGILRTSFPVLPTTTESISLHLVKKANHLGLDLEASEDRSLNGCLVRNIVSGSAAEKDKRVKEGDFVIAVNNESLKGATTAQAKAILRRASLLGGRREREDWPFHGGGCRGPEVMPDRIGKGNECCHGTIG